MKRLLPFVLLIASGCNNNSESKHTEQEEENIFESNTYHFNGHSCQQGYEGEDSEENGGDYYEDEENDNPRYGDGTHNATVDYYNPNTGHRATYTLDVEIEDGEVNQINWPNGGWSDEDHITPAELDDDGSTTIYGEEGKTYDVQIDD